MLNGGLIIIVLKLIIVTDATVLYENRASFCSLRGHDYTCSPPFTNIMKTAKIKVSSDCGMVQSENICKFWKYYAGNRFDKDCKICFRKLHDYYSKDNIKDNHLTLNQTCWFSGALLNRANFNYVNITIELEKLFQIYYIAIQFCSRLPDSIAIYKSSDYGLTYHSWQFYSKDCQRQFQMPPIDEYSFLQQVRMNPLKPNCIQLNKHSKSNDLDLEESILPFSTTIGRKINETLLQWISITNIRLVLYRFIEPDQLKHRYFDYSKYLYGRDRKGRDIVNMSFLSVSNEEINKMNRLNRLVDNNNNNNNNDDDKGDGNDEVYYGISDISIGGRCQCNGHSNKCILDNAGRIRCACEHNTAGVDCDQCAVGYQDTPWSSGSQNAVVSCKKCNCNLHSRDCDFSQSIFESNGHRSGGVCRKCLHNTAGRHCHYCQKGFHRDWRKPLSHEHACIKCRCHAVGSKNSGFCDKETGQCFCKTGVTGKSCDRCRHGYKETESVITPCIIKYKIRQRYVPNHLDPNGRLVSDPHYQFMANTESECKPCNEKRKRIRFKKFCRRDAVFMGTIQSKEIHGKMARFEMLIKKVWRKQNNKNKDLSLKKSRNSRNLFDWKAQYNKITNINFQNNQNNYIHLTPATTISLWITHEDVRCECPSIHLGRSYLVLTKFKIRYYRNRNELILDPPRSVVLPWKVSWNRRLRKFTLKSKQGRCDRFFQRKKSKIKSYQQLIKKQRRRRFRQLSSSILSPSSS